ncbi:unnamed protein product, partial [Prorocentrum cordatum]
GCSAPSTACGTRRRAPSAATRGRCWRTTPRWRGSPRRTRSCRRRRGTRRTRTGGSRRRTSASSASCGSRTISSRRCGSETGSWRSWCRRRRSRSVSSCSSCRPLRPPNPQRTTNALYRSYQDSQDDWGEAERISLPDATALPQEADGHVRAISTTDLQRAADVVAEVQSRKAPHSAPVRPSQGAVLARMSAAADAARGSERVPTGTTPFSPPRRSKLAQSLDSAQVRECLAGGFDVDHIIRCLATALQNKIILAMGRSRPHGASAECIRACGIFLEPACRQRLESDAAAALGRQQCKASAASAPSPGTGGGTPLSSFCSPLMSKDQPGACLLDTMGKPVEPLNGIAWDVYGFLRDVMVNFRLEPEVSVVTMNYVDRFSDTCGVALTPDNWQRLIITAMMLASKVWNDESFENVEFAQLCPLYTLDEINTFERTFLKCVGYNMSVKGSDYAKTYFQLRTLGAKDCASLRAQRTRVWPTARTYVGTLFSLLHTRIHTLPHTSTGDYMKCMWARVFM